MLDRVSCSCRRAVVCTTGAIVLAALAGCGAGDGRDLDANGRPLGETGPAVALAATFPSVQANLFNVSCAVAGCHSGAQAPLGLDLSAGRAYGNLVGVPGITTVEGNTVLRVNAGNPDISLLLLKLEGDSRAGARMPLDRDAVDPAIVALVREWIANGAPETGTGGTGSSSAQVAATTPADGALLNNLPDQIQILFDSPIDGSSLGAASVALERSGGDGGFDDGNEVPLSLDAAQITLNPQLTTATIDLAGLGSAEDVYRLTLRGDGADVIRDTDGLVLDGDGDGAAGGDRVQFFTIETVPPTFAALRDRLFLPTCAVSGCHSGSSPAGGMNLEAGQTYASLLQTGRTRIVPNNPDASLVVQFMEARFMPLVVPPGFESERQGFITAIRAWINSGAPP